MSLITLGGRMRAIRARFMRWSPFDTLLLFLVYGLGAGPSWSRHRRDLLLEGAPPPEVDVGHAAHAEAERGHPHRCRGIYDPRRSLK